MEKYSKILIYIFLLTGLNLIISGYLIYKTNFNYEAKKVAVVATSTPKPSSPATTKTTSQDQDVKSDLIQIKAEIRALRESVENSGLVVETPKP